MSEGDIGGVQLLQKTNAERSVAGKRALIRRGAEQITPKSFRMLPCSSWNWSDSWGIFAIILKAREREARTRIHLSYKASYHPATARLLRSGRAQSKFSRSGHARSHGTGTRSLSRHSPEPTVASALVSHTKAQAVANIWSPNGDSFILSLLTLPPDCTNADRSAVVSLGGQFSVRFLKQKTAPFLLVW